VPGRYRIEQTRRGIRHPSGDPTDWAGLFGRFRSSPWPDIDAWSRFARF
jgi:hypothetical protein